jgi:hypothetical protein
MGNGPDIVSIDQVPVFKGIADKNQDISAEAGFDG